VHLLRPADPPRGRHRPRTKSGRSKTARSRRRASRHARPRSSSSAT
jgi:hypothetical protein